MNALLRGLVYLVASPILLSLFLAERLRLYIRHTFHPFL